MIKQNKATKRSTRYGADISQLSVPFSVRATQEVSTNYIIDLWDTLENLTDIEEAVFVLGIAKEEDTVTINLNSDGGSHYVGDALLLAMNNCLAEIHVRASGRICSYATFVLLACDSFEISPFCQILCHSASFGVYAKMGETKQRLEFEYKQCEDMIRYYYEGFLSDEEITRIINQGYEHWMDSKEFVERFQKMVEYRQAKLDILQQGDEDDDEEPSSCCKGTVCNCGAGD